MIIIQKHLEVYCSNEPAVSDNGVIIDFNAANITDSFTFKEKITGQTDNNDTKTAEIMVSLKCLYNFWRTSLVDCEVNLILTWFVNCVIVSAAVANHGTAFTITDARLYVPVVTLSM